MESDERMWGDQPEVLAEATEVMRLSLRDAGKVVQVMHLVDINQKARTAEARYFVTVGHGVFDESETIEVRSAHDALVALAKTQQHASSDEAFDPKQFGWTLIPNRTENANLG